MQGWFLFRDSVVQLWVHRGAMVRIVLPVAGALILVEFATLQLLHITSPQTAQVEIFNLQSATEGFRSSWVVFAFLIVSNLLIWTVGLSVVAVRWYGHVLSEEPCGWRPVVRFDRVYAHSLALIAVVFVSGLLFVLAFWLMSWVGLPSFGWAGLGVMFVIVFGLSSQFLRFALIMPGAATGDERDLDAILPMTDNAAGALFVVAALYGACSLALGIPAMMFVGVWTEVFDLVLAWFFFALSLAILSTLYRHYIAGHVPA